MIKLANSVEKLWVFRQIRRCLGTYFDIDRFRQARWMEQNPYRTDPPYSTYESPYPFTLGIIKELWELHWHYIAACRELTVAYRVIDISGPDWLEVVRATNSDAFLVRPSVQSSVWKALYEERLRIISFDLRKIIYPTYDELWFWESKRRLHYWLEAHGLPHPKTWVFYNLQQALHFAAKASLPIVTKTDLGSGASGVRILRSRDKLLRHVRRAFGRGIGSYRRRPKDKEWGFIIFQEYLSNVREWRIVRVGNSFFGYEKLPRGDFHSGSHRWRFDHPPLALLDFARSTTDRFGFSSMAFDIFVIDRHSFMVNEMQTLFGMGTPYEQCVVDGNPGRLVYDENKKQWHFETGDFCRNHLCNLRVAYLAEKLKTSENIDNS